ncbi:MAG: phage tail tip protein J-related protein [Aeromonas veronii]
MPPVVVGIVAGIAAYAVPAVTLGMALSIGAAAMSLMSVLTAKQPSFDAFRSPQERKQVVRSAAAAKNGVYGTVMGSGVLFFAEEEPGDQTEGEWLHLCLTVAGHPVNGIGQILLNDEPLESYGENVSWELHNDRQTADPFLLQHCPSWSSDMIGRGISFLRISFKFDVEKFPSGIPNIKFVKHGWSVYDPRDGQTKFTDNAALIYLHYLRHYRKVPDSDILWDHFKAAANICTEAVPIGDNQYENRYTINGEFDVDENPTKVMQAMLDACGGNPVYTGGKHGILVGAYNGPAVHNLYEHQIVGDIEISPETSLADACNTMTGKFVNKADNWSECDFPKVSVPEYVAEDGREYANDVNYRFVTSVYQAQRLAMINLQRKRVGRSMTIPMNFSAFGYRPGESVNLYIPTLGIDGVEFRIVKWDFSLKDAIGLVVIQDNPTIYGDIVGRPIVRPPLTSLPTGGPAMPDNLRYDTSPVGDVIQGSLTWINRGVYAYNEVLLMRGQNVVQSVQVPGQTCRFGGLVADSYSAMVRAVGLNGASSQWATIAFTVAVPPVPSRVDVEAGNWDLSLFPKFTSSLAFGTICEFFYYRSDLTIDQVEAKAQRLGMGTSLVHNGLQPNTLHYYWVRSINAYGKSAFFPLTAKTTKDVDSVLDIISGSIGAEDLIEELRKPLENTIDMWTAKVGNTDLDKYGGIGLTIETDPDGVTRVKCVVDAEVFAILDPSGATGVGSRHPFVVKDGVVYMNKLLLDDAEIGQVIAKYINVEHLVGTLIEAATIRSSDNGQSFSLLPDGTLNAKKANITGEINATSGNFKGSIQAESGTLNNVIVQENCNVLGTIYANKIVGDVCRVISTTQTNFEITMTPFGRARKLVIIPCGCKLQAPWSGSNFTARAIIELYVNGAFVSRATSPEVVALSSKTAFCDFSGYGFETTINPNASTTIKFVARLDGDYSAQGVLTVQSPMIAMAFIQ